MMIWSRRTHPTLIDGLWLKKSGLLTLKLSVGSLFSLLQMCLFSNTGIPRADSKLTRNPFTASTNQDVAIS